MYLTTKELRKIKASIGFELHISVNLGLPLEGKNDDLLLFKITSYDSEEFDEHLNKNVIRKIIRSELVDEEFTFGQVNYFDFYYDLNLKSDFIYLNIDGHLEKLILYDDKDIPYKLKPTETWPTLLIGPTPMHRSKEVTVKEDTELKLKYISPIKGIALDTCFGAGYTCLLLSKKADEVYSFDINENVLELAKINPFTADLFDDDEIKIQNKNIIVEIVNFNNNFFDRIIHDPPTGNDFTELYNISFYEELYRVLKQGGKLYHYVPRPGINSNKNVLFEKVIKRLNTVGFKDVKYIEETSGIIASK